MCSAGGYTRGKGALVSDDSVSRRYAGADPISPGNVGRRVALRRAELGLSRGEAACLAGVSEAYLQYMQYMEEQPADVMGRVLSRLAGKPKTGTRRSRGGDVDIVTGQGRASAQPTLEEMTSETRRERLGTHGIGRIAVAATRAGPIVLPVNYSVVDDVIVYRATAVLVRRWSVSRLGGSPVAALLRRCGVTGAWACGSHGDRW